MVPILAIGGLLRVHVASNLGVALPLHTVLVFSGKTSITLVKEVAART
jgi:hypothetical protein